MKAIQAPTRLDNYAKADRHIRIAQATLSRADHTRTRSIDSLTKALEQLETVDLRSLRTVKARDAVKSARNQIKVLIRQQAELPAALEAALAKVGAVLTADTPLSKAG